jgi:hypothetical protein
MSITGGTVWPEFLYCFFLWTRDPLGESRTDFGLLPGLSGHYLMLLGCIIIVYC